MNHSYLQLSIDIICKAGLEDLLLEENKKGQERKSLCSWKVTFYVKGTSDTLLSPSRADLCSS